MQNDSPASARARRDGSCLSVLLGGSWELEKGWPSGCEDIVSEARRPDVSSLRVTSDGLGNWDSCLLTFLMELISAARKRHIPVSRELPKSLDRLVDLTFAVEKKEGSARSREEDGLLAVIGSCIAVFPEGCRRMLDFFGDIIIALLRFLSGRSSMKSSDLWEAMYQCGVRSLPIVAVTNMLFGLILAFVGAVQLKMFGAQIYVAGLVGIGMLRVMGAVMVGVVMSGRIGASYAALIGTMQVNEEIDALETMGISPVDYLVLPRMLALSIMVPLLTVFADAMGIFGGFLVAISMLDLSPMQYLTATAEMVHYDQGIIGLCYAAVFGIIIAISGCYHGIHCGRSAQAVGEATTTAVVHAIVGIIVATAIITVICNVLGV